MKLPLRGLPLLAGLSLLVSCGQKPLETSGATETGNTKVTGLVRGAAGGSAARVRVEIVPVDYNPIVDDTAKPPADTTVADGEYAFTVRRGSAYNVVGMQLETGERFLIRNVAAAGDSIQVPIGNLAPPGAVKVALEHLDYLLGSEVYLAGIPLSARIDSSSVARGYVLLDSVPAGSMPGLLLFTGEESRILVLENRLTVSPGQVSLVNADGVWPEYRRLYLNTSPTGADVSESVAGFPLLVRLDASNFDFAQAGDSGRDLRFAKPDGSPLPREIARWDASGGRAEVWVRLDTLHGDSDSQYIEMFWGNAEAIPAAPGPGVFDTAAGFVSVWHLDAAPDAGTLRYDDATANRLHGTGVNMAAADGVEGVVGIAQHFRGTGGYIDIPNSAGGPLNFPQRGEYSISAWVRADSLPARYQTLIGKGDNQFNLQISREKMWHFVEAQMSGQFEAVEVPAQAAAWRLLTGVRDGAGMALYVDGVLVDNQPAVKAETANRIEAINVSLGWNNEAAGQAFAGTLDEVAISKVARSPAWIKLTFENQKRGQSLVQVRSE